MKNISPFSVLGVGALCKKCAQKWEETKPWTVDLVSDGFVREYCVKTVKECVHGKGYNGCGFEPKMEHGGLLVG